MGSLVTPSTFSRAQIALSVDPVANLTSVILKGHGGGDHLSCGAINDKVTHAHKLWGLDHSQGVCHIPPNMAPGVSVRNSCCE